MPAVRAVQWDCETVSDWYECHQQTLQVCCSVCPANDSQPRQISDILFFRVQAKLCQISVDLGITCVYKCLCRKVWTTWRCLLCIFTKTIGRFCDRSDHIETEIAVSVLPCYFSYCSNSLAPWQNDCYLRYTILSYWTHFLIKCIHIFSLGSHWWSQLWLR